MFNGNRLKALREASGQTQEELANALGVAHQQIWRWESGKNDPAGSMIAQMAQIYKVSSDYLLNLIDDTNPSKGDYSPFEIELITSLRRGKLSRVFALLTEWAGEVSFINRKRIVKPLPRIKIESAIKCDKPQREIEPWPGNE